MTFSASPLSEVAVTVRPVSGLVESHARAHITLKATHL